MADQMADNKTGGAQEMAREQVVLSTGEASGTPSSPSPGTEGVDLATIARMLSQTRETIDRTAGNTSH